MNTAFYRHLSGTGTTRNFTIKRCFSGSDGNPLPSSYLPCTTVVRDKLTAQEKDAFWRDGYVVLPSLLSAGTVAKLIEVFPKLFAGHFSTGVYPDEWHWREGISLPTASREINNAWKSDHCVRSVVLCPSIGKLVAHLMGWDAGTRIGQDDVLWKPCGGSSVGFHQDARYISDQFVPHADNSVTLWMGLDNTDDGNGCVQYVKGSHRWRPQAGCTAAYEDAISQAFHCSSDGYDKAVYAAAARCGVCKDDVEIVGTEVPAGGAILHHQDIWHGSGPNKSTDRLRRALVGHYIRADALFRRSPPPTYIYGRYQLGDSSTLHDSFFPVIYTP